jgi:hypothetical protein
MLLAADSPYSVTAAYSGDTTFGLSSDTISQTVTAATTHITLSFDPKPTAGEASVVTATLSGGSGSLPTGDVTFVIASSDPTKPVMLLCGGVKSPGANFAALSSNGATKPEAVATCDLVAGWFNVPAATTGDPHPSATWEVSASYDGDNNYGHVLVSKKGRSKG